MSRLREWFRWHSVRQHVLVPLWKRVPEKRRWDVVYWLNENRLTRPRYCWVDLVDAAMMPADGPDACDGRLPLPDARHVTAHCAGPCGFRPEHADHTKCTCYCGKFRVGGGLA